MKRIISILSVCLGVLLLAGCKSARKPVGADKANTERTYRQTHDNSVGQGTMSRETRELLHRYGQDEQFEQSPDETLRVMHEKAVATRNRVEAVLIDGKGAGQWVFRLRGGAIRPGTVHVQSGVVALVTGDRVVFRLAGRPGERVTFTFDTAP